MKKVQLLIVCITLLLWSGINAQERRTVHSDDAVTLKNVSAFNIEQKAQAEAELKTPVAAENKKPEKQQRSVAAECSVPVFPLNEGFQGFPPECWQIFNVDGNDWSWGHISGNINGEDYMATWSTSIGDMEDNWLVTRLVSVPASNNITLQFKNVQGCYNTGGTINHGVYVSTGSNNPADGNFTEIWTMPETGTSAGIIDVNLTSYAGQDIYIGFRFAGNNQWNWEITDIRVFDTNKIDAQVVSIISPISNGDLGNETVKALIKNNGGQNITGCSLTLEVDGAEVATETFTQSISLFEEVEYTFAAKANLSAEGDHVVKVTVNLAGDGDASNNSSSKTVTNTICRPITSYPWSEGFESEVFPPACWASYNVDGDNLSWEKYTSYYHSGSASARHPFNYWGDNNQEGWLVTPQLSIPSTGSYILTFWSVINNFRGSDEAAIYVSTTGNNPSTDTFTQIKTISSDEISSTSFKEMAVSLSDYAGQNIYIGFKHKSDEALNWYLDDIGVMDATSKTDAEIISVTSTPSGVNLTSTEPVKAVIKNNGYLPLTGFSMKLEVNGVIVATETYTGSIPPLSEAEYTFTATADLSSGRTHNIKVTVIADNDTNAGNDSKTIHVSNTVCNDITSFPWKEGFDAGITACWQIIDNDADDWNWMGATLSGTGDNVVVSYSNDPFFGQALTPNDYLVSPRIILPTGTQYNLMLTVGANNDNFAEKYSVLVSTTGTDISDFTEVYTETLTSKDFKIVTIPLSTYSGAIHIAFRHWDCTNQSALILDDVTIMKGTSYVDVEMVSVESPVTGTNCSSAEPVKVKIKNKGTAAASAFSLKVEVNGVEAFTESYTGAPIPSFSIVDYTLTNTLDLSAEGVYSIKATVITDNDIDAANDFKVVNVINEIINCPGTVSRFPWTEGFENTAFAPCWTTIDADGDSYNWQKHIGSPHSGTGAAMSESYRNNIGALTPDNYLITPQITLPADGEAALSFWIRALDMTYYAEHYEVKVSTTGNNAADFTTTLVDETLDSNQWKEKNVSLDNYLGQSIYIAFVHNKITDKYVLVLDDVTVTATGIVGIDQQRSTGIKVYPNPAKDVLYIDTPDAIQIVAVYTTNGTQIMNLKNTGNSIDVSHLPQGAYIVKVTTISGIFRAKILKQ